MVPHTHLAECLPKIVRQKCVQHRINAGVRVRQYVCHNLYDDAGVCDFVHVEGLQHQYDLRMAGMERWNQISKHPHGGSFFFCKRKGIEGELRIKKILPGLSISTVA